MSEPEGSRPSGRRFGLSPASRPSSPSSARSSPSCTSASRSARSEPRASPLAELERPAESLERLVTRELDLAGAPPCARLGVAALPRAVRRRQSAPGGDWYAELVEDIDSSAIELHRAIMLGEAGRTDRLGGESRSGARTGPARADGGVGAAAYVGPPPAADAGRALIAEIDAIAPTWFTDTLSAASRRGSATPRRARRPRRPSSPAAGCCCVRAGSGTPRAARSLGASRRSSGWSPARAACPRGRRALPPVWATADGYALFVRGLGAPQAIALVVFIALRRETGSAPCSAWRRTCRSSGG